MNTAVPSPAQRLGRVGSAVLTLATALIHLSLNFPAPTFMLNGLGYLARWALLGFTAPTMRWRCSRCC